MVMMGESVLASAADVEVVIWSGTVEPTKANPLRLESTAVALLHACFF